MSHLKPEEISHLAGLARVSLNDDEKKKLAEQLPGILKFIDQLQKADVGDPRGYDVISLESLRDDEVDSDSLSLDQLKKLAPKWAEIPPAGGQVVVPPVFGESDNL